VENAAQKGARSSLVLLDERAFLISVANRTVITAMDSEGMKEQMVTDIDSAVIL
jgi:flagellar operon protein